MIHNNQKKKRKEEEEDVIQIYHLGLLDESANQCES